MNLEDHLGDIVRKARAMAGVSAADAARAAGLSEAEYSTLEESGTSSGKIKFTELGSLLGLNAAKLEGIAKGWLPSPKDLSVWRELRHISTTESGTEVHCYLIWDEVTREAALFDTGWDAAPILKIVEAEQLQLKHLFITHAHRDHVMGMEKIREVFPKIFLHSDSKTALPQHKNRRNDHIHLGSLRITNRETPGHAEDGVTYVVGNWSEDAPYVAIVGDTLFAGSMGGAAQNGALAKQKIRDQILTLPPDTLICPGHGPLTTVAEEKAHNPFF
ncbi:MAG TPA: MBL fold metallo-hydrolase [Verrucomicrobiae bacterium]|jgi:glyoxylase-like metal-dependent hydrolase (beta-lactamase superfamily II)|nr:MBL fold metallo-hydrolase [Verrucomicrobiae bacterium]